MRWQCCLSAPVALADCATAAEYRECMRVIKLACELPSSSVYSSSVALLFPAAAVSGALHASVSHAKQLLNILSTSVGW
jgi:hypothetical protein